MKKGMLITSMMTRTISKPSSRIPRTRQKSPLTKAQLRRIESVTPILSRMKAGADRDSATSAKIPGMKRRIKPIATMSPTRSGEPGEAEYPRLHPVEGFVRRQRPAQHRLRDDGDEATAQGHRHDEEQHVGEQREQEGAEPRTVVPGVGKEQIDDLYGDYEDQREPQSRLRVHADVREGPVEDLPDTQRTERDDPGLRGGSEARSPGVSRRGPVAGLAVPGWRLAVTGSGRTRVAAGRNRVGRTRVAAGHTPGWPYPGCWPP